MMIRINLSKIVSIDASDWKTLNLKELNLTQLVCWINNFKLFNFHFISNLLKKRNSENFTDLKQFLRKRNVSLVWCVIMLSCVTARTMPSGTICVARLPARLANILSWKIGKYHCSTGLLAFVPNDGKCNQRPLKISSTRKRQPKDICQLQSWGRT